MSKVTTPELLPLSPPWAGLPDLIIHSIATRLSSFQDLAAFAGTCIAWRSIVSRDALLESLIQQQPLLLMVDLIPPPLSLPADELRFVCTTNGKMYEKYLPMLRGLSVIGQSFRHLIMVPSRYEIDPPHRFYVLILDMYSGTGMTYGGYKPPRRFVHACLTAPPTSSDCLLVLVSSSVIQYCSIGGGQWYVMEYLDQIISCKRGQHSNSSMVISAVAIKDKLFVTSSTGRVVEVKINPRDRQRQEIWSEEDHMTKTALAESQGKLIMVRNREVYRFDPLTREWERIRETCFVTHSSSELRNHVVWKPQPEEEG